MQVIFNNFQQPFFYRLFHRNFSKVRNFVKFLFIRSSKIVSTQHPLFSWLFSLFLLFSVRSGYGAIPVLFRRYYVLITFVIRKSTGREAKENPKYKDVVSEKKSR